MSQKYSFIYIFSALLLLIGLACVTTTAVPSQQQPLSTSKPSEFATTVAGTAAALMAQTMEAMPSSTESLSQPPETLTPVPTSTPVVETAAPTNTAEENETTSLSKMEDESTQFFDFQAGVNLTFPADWLVVRISGQEYLDAKNDAEVGSVIKHSLEAIQDLERIIYRVHAFNVQEGFVYEGEGSQISVQFFEGDTRGLELIAETEIQQKNYPGYEFITFEYQDREDNLTLFIFEETWLVSSSTNQQVEINHKRVVFKVSSGTVFIDLHVPSELQANVVREFDAIVEQLSVFDP